MVRIARSSPRASGARVLAAAVTSCVLACAHPAAARAVPACAPEKTFQVTIATSERGEDGPLVATHDVTAEARIAGTTVQEELKPPAGVPVVAGGKGGIVAFIVPAAASVPLTATWQQSSDPENPESDPEDPATSCIGTRTVDVPILPARPSRAIKERGWQVGFSNFAVVPALVRPDLSPLEITVQTTGRASYPRAKDPSRTMRVPMRTVDQVEYDKELPNLAYIGTAEKCRYFMLICGPVFSEVSALPVDDRALRRGVVQGEINGSKSLLARTQPALRAARYGIGVEARPGSARVGSPRPFGYDLQVRQSGRLIGRVRAAGRCVERRTARGLFTSCKVRRKVALR